ncbi:MAG TPA: exonuclease domain-containing protein [Pseudomonadales bacterium]|nr:exonuclease domain-containing protein [Pseudomonadales bacterium]
MRYWYLFLKRTWYAYKLREHRVNAFFSSALPAFSAYSDEVEFLSIDIETTSLDHNEGEIVSIGWVPLRHGSIILSEARHLVVGVRREVGQSAVFHHISDEQSSYGARASEMFWQLLQAANGRVLVFHNAHIDMAYLNKLSRRLIGAPIVAPIVDTLQWEKTKILKRYHLIPTDSLRLHACRRRYGLPDYPLHNALSDALATLELLQAQIAYLGHRAKLGEILKKSEF